MWAERGRLIEDVRNVATSLFSLAEDASDRFPEDGDRSGGATVAVAAPASPRGAAGAGDCAGLRALGAATVRGGDRPDGAGPVRSRERSGRAGTPAGARPSAAPRRPRRPRRRRADSERRPD